MNPIENVKNIMKEENGNQISSKKEEMLKGVCEAWYCVASNVMDELYNAMLRRTAYLINAKGDLTIYWLYDVGLHCYCVFIEMYLKYDVVLSLECIWYLFTNDAWLCVDMIYRNTKAWE